MRARRRERGTALRSCSSISCATATNRDAISVHYKRLASPLIQIYAVKDRVGIAAVGMQRSNSREWSMFESTNNEDSTDPKDDMSGSPSLVAMLLRQTLQPNRHYRLWQRHRQFPSFIHSTSTCKKGITISLAPKLQKRNAQCEGGI